MTLVSLCSLAKRWERPADGSMNANIVSARDDGADAVLLEVPLRRPSFRRRCFARVTASAGMMRRDRENRQAA